MKTYEYDHKVYTFRLSRKAKIELEEFAQRKTDLLNQSSVKEYLPLLIKLQMKEKLSKEEERNLNDHLGSILMLLNQLNKPMDYYEVGYILLKNHIHHKDMSLQEFDELVWNMEETLGVEETYHFFKEIHDMVFTQMGNMK